MCDFYDGFDFDFDFPLVKDKKDKRLPFPRDNSSTIIFPLHDMLLHSWIHWMLNEGKEQMHLFLRCDCYGCCDFLEM